MKIICISRNYILHAQELNHRTTDEPVFFFKPDTALTDGNEPFFMPDFAERFDYECELVVKINRVGKSIETDFAHRYYSEVALGIDFTARSLQQKEISQGQPWTLSKCFDCSAAVSKFISLAELQKDIANLNFSLLKNGKIVQQANTCQMLFPVDFLISYISKFITLKHGDLIFTGTPSGIGQINIGDHLTGYLEDKKFIDIAIK